MSLSRVHVGCTDGAPVHATIPRFYWIFTLFVALREGRQVVAPTLPPE
jgi:hypothetical protein